MRSTVDRQRNLQHDILKLDLPLTFDVDLEAQLFIGTLRRQNNTAQVHLSIPDEFIMARDL